MGLNFEAETAGMRATRLRWEADSGGDTYLRLLLPSTGGEPVPLFLRKIPVGSALLGARDRDADVDPPIKVVVEQPYYFGVFSVTQAQFACWVESPDYATFFEQALAKNYFEEEDAKPHTNEFPGNPTHPAESLNYYEAEAFCEWLQVLANEQLKLTASELRLPNEREWEYACRAGSKTEYYGGDGEAALQSLGWYDGNADGQTRPVGHASKSPNDWGLYDLHGNVFEWSRDLYSQRGYREVSSLAVDLRFSGRPDSKEDYQHAAFIKMAACVLAGEPLDAQQLQTCRKYVKIFRTASKDAQNEALKVNYSEVFKAFAAIESTLASGSEGETALDEAKAVLKQWHDFFHAEQASVDVLRVLRGGSWRYGAAYCRSAIRYWDRPSNRNWFRGFRVGLFPVSGASQPEDGVGVGAGQDEAAERAQSGPDTTPTEPLDLSEETF